MSKLSYSRRNALKRELAYAQKKLDEYGEMNAGTSLAYKEIPFNISVYDKKKFIGIIDGAVIYDWLYIDLLWIDEKYRSRGIGSTLIQKAYDKAKKHRVKGIEVWTHSYQSPKFYKKLGFKQFIEQDDYVPGHKVYGLRKLVKYDKKKKVA